MTKIISLPGLIDVHTHLREPGATQKEDFETGTKAALAGGYTSILDMPNNPIPTTSPEALMQKIELANTKIYCDVGFNFGATANSSQYFEQVKNQVFGLKVYMNHTTGDLLMEDDTALKDVFSKWPKGKIIMVHAEGETLKKAIDLAKQYQQRLHVCHVSLKSQIEMIRKAKQEGMPITCEVTCHHLFLSEEDVEKLGSFGVMRPPLVSKEDQQALWDNLNIIDMIASDHAPHTKQEKEESVHLGKPINGVPGLETSLPLLLTAVNKGKLTMEKLIDLTSTKAREIFAIPEQIDTYVEVDMDEEYQISNENLFTKCAWTPFEGVKVKGRVQKVVLRGKTVLEHGKVIEKLGKVIFPN